MLFLFHSTRSRLPQLAKFKEESIEKREYCLLPCPVMWFPEEQNKIPLNFPSAYRNAYCPLWNWESSTQERKRKKSCKWITNLELSDHLPQLLINQRAKVMCSILQSPLESTKRRIFSSNISKQAFSRGYTKWRYKVLGLTVVQPVVLPYRKKQQMSFATLSFQRSLGAEYYENRQ